jgi:hypothetical protein
MAALSAVDREDILMETWQGEAGSARLSQLLYRILNPDLPAQQNATLTFVVPEGVSPIEFRNSDPDAPLFNFTSPRGNPLGSVAYSETKGLITKNAEGKETTGLGNIAGAPGAGQGGNTFPATVLSGSGQNYQVTVYRNGRSQPGEAVAATHPGITASNEAVPAGTICSVIQIGSTYELAVQVWLEESA